jgi:anti-sigma regulatory factor (Ser/Thr protein kinase)
MRVAGIVVAALAVRLPLDPALQTRADIALHEALANAALHGNLELASMRRDGLDGLRGFAQAFDGQLGKTELRRRRIIVGASWTCRKLTLSVCNEGEGYDFRNLDTGETDLSPGDPHGLPLLRALADDITISDSGRCISLDFQR